MIPQLAALWPFSTGLIRKFRLAIMLALVGLAVVAGPAALSQPETQPPGFVATGALADFALEQRARALGRTLRCVVCANQSIEDSDVPLAQSMRRLVRERLLAGKGEQDIRAELIAAYGQYVTYRPSLSGFGWLLYVAPWAGMLAALAVVVAVRRRRGHIAILDRNR